MLQEADSETSWQGGSPTEAQIWWTAVGSSSLTAYGSVSSLSCIETKSFVSKL